MRAERAALLSTVYSVRPCLVVPLLLRPPLSPPSLFSKPPQRSPGYEHQSHEDFFQAFFYSSFYIKKKIKQNEGKSPPALHRGDRAGL